MEKTYFIESKEKYLELIKAWKEYVNNGGTPTAAHMILYNIIRSKQWDKGFSPTTKEIKLINGHNPWFGLRNAAWLIRAAAVYSDSYYLRAFDGFYFGLEKKEFVELLKRAWELIKSDPRLK